MVSTLFLIDSFRNVRQCNKLNMDFSKFSMLSFRIYMYKLFGKKYQLPLIYLIAVYFRTFKNPIGLNSKFWTIGKFQIENIPDNILFSQN